MSDASSSGFTVSGAYSDAADFAVLMLLDADDTFGHLYSNRYLPDFDLTGVKLDFDCAIVNGHYPGSSKFQSVPWGKLSWIKSDGTAGTTALNITSTTGLAHSSTTYTITSSLVPIAGNRVQLIYLGNVVYDYLVVALDTPTTIATGLAAIINAATGSSSPFTATHSGATFTITCTLPGNDGNLIELWAQSSSATAAITPNGNWKMAGGTDPSTFHAQIDFTGLTSLRQCWLTFAPPLPVSIGGSTPTMVAFAPLEFSYVFSNWALTDPSTHTPLKVADPVKSVVTDSRSAAVSYTGTWTQEAGSTFHHGYARGSSTIGDTVTISYSCSYTHDLYLGTSLYTDRCMFGVTLDGSGQPDLDCFLGVGSALVTRRAIASGVAAGSHTVVIEIKAGSFGNVGYFDFLHASIAADPVNGTAYPTVSSAADWDTMAYQLPPARLIDLYLKMGLTGRMDFYGGVFFALKRRRKGGDFLTATCTVAGTASGDTFFLDISGTAFGAQAFAADTDNSMAQRFVDGVNALFVGVRATNSGGGVFTVTTLSPINGFTITTTTGGGSAGTISHTGNIGVLSNGVEVGGQEGIWEVDPLPVSPLNRAFSDYLRDLSTVADGAGIVFTLAWSMELLAPPDANTSSGAWIQRYNDATPVLTSTGFGSWGSGYVAAVSVSLGVSTVNQPGHGYITGYLAHFNGGTGHPVTVIDANNYTVPTSVSVLDAVYVELQTSQCAFSPLTVTPYLSLVYQQSAAIIDAAGVVPWLQFGEVLHWFFSGGSGPSMAYYDANQAAAAVIVLGRALATFTTPNDSPAINSHADANFLVARLQSHIASIVSDVLGVVAGSKFELLWPYDVNWLTAYTGPMSQPSIGGQLNRYVNLPPDYAAPGTDLDAFRIEALAWQFTYRTRTNSLATVAFWRTDTTWPIADSRILVSWQDGGCAWREMALAAFNEGYGQVVYWAIDQGVGQSWNPAPPANQSNATFC